MKIYRGGISIESRFIDMKNELLIQIEPTTQQRGGYDTFCKVYSIG